MRGTLCRSDDTTVRLYQWKRQLPLSCIFRVNMQPVGTFLRLYFAVCQPFFSSLSGNEVVFPLNRSSATCHCS